MTLNEFCKKYNLLIPECIKEEFRADLIKLCAFALKNYMKEMSGGQLK